MNYNIAYEKAQNTLFEYMNALDDATLMLRDFVHAGCTYEETYLILRLAIDELEIIDIELIKTKWCNELIAS